MTLQATLGLPPREVIARHAAAEYLVACMGFAPGFPYLMGMPAELATPRLPDPRTRVPAGSIAIGGHQTGIYSMETAGGWRIIGRTPVRLFDLGQAKPSFSSRAIGSGFDGSRRTRSPRSNRSAVQMGTR